MRKNLPIIIFITVQLASAAILIVWILLYINFHSQFSELVVKYGIDPTYETRVLWLLQGIFLIPVIGGATLIFIYWNKYRELDSMRIDFISSVSHELLTPLASLKLYIETMKIRDVDEENREQFLDFMLEDAERLATLITQILVASKIESKKAIYHFKKNDLAHVIEKFIENRSAMLKNAKITLDLDSDCFCLIDNASFETMLKNLLQNAILYSAESASISIVLRKTGGRVLLSCSDKGEGIEKKNLKRIFDMFYRATRKNKGTGLGLFITKSIVDAHKGKIWAESQGNGKGAAFKITLPALKNSKE